MKIKFTASAAAFLARRARRRAELLAEPPLDWGAATVLTVTAPAGGAPSWQIAATACPTASKDDPVPRPALLYAFGPDRAWVGRGADVAGVLAALVARALARSATVEVFLAAESLPATERERVLDALSTDDVHQVPAGLTSTRDAARFRLDAEAGYAQLAAGLVSVTRPALVDLPTGDITRGRLMLAKCSPAQKRLLGAVALCAQQSRLAAELKPWAAYRPDGTAAAAYAERASSTTIACNSCAMTADNCREEREAAAIAHALKWKRDPYEEAAPGLSAVARTPLPVPDSAALVSPRAMAVSAARHASTVLLMDATSAACVSAAAAVRSALSLASSAADLTAASSVPSLSRRLFVAACQCSRAVRSAPIAFCVVPCSPARVSMFSLAVATAVSRAPMRSTAAFACRTASREPAPMPSRPSAILPRSSVRPFSPVASAPTAPSVRSAHARASPAAAAAVPEALATLGRSSNRRESVSESARDPTVSATRWTTVVCVVTAALISALWTARPVAVVSTVVTRRSSDVSVIRTR